MMNLGIGNDLGNVQVESRSTEYNDSIILSAEKLSYYDRCVEGGMRTNMPSPYYMNIKGLRKGRLTYAYNENEMKEIAKCATDIHYFANNYCTLMTDTGIQRISLYPFQYRVLSALVNYRDNILLAARQSSKTSLSAMFLMHYVCFNSERNVFIVANKAETMQEIIEKVHTIYENLPFFMKPGILEDNKRRLVFDNGCRIIGQATTPKPGLGFAIHLLYIDEFAHIPSHIIEPFYNAIYPTVSASAISKVIISSTPFGPNLFFRLWKDALLGKNEYNPIKIDWNEKPGRDEEWKARQIANLGSESAFNQEYGNQFLSSSELLVDAHTSKKLENKIKEFEYVQITDLDDLGMNYEELKWHPDYLDIDLESKQIVVSIDPSNGVGKDYTVVNIFEVCPFDLPELDLLNRSDIKDETDFFKLKQIGLFRTNGMPLNQFAIFLEKLLFKLFNPENLTIVLEVNLGGDLILDRLSRNSNFEPEIVLHTYHSQTAKTKQPGLKLNVQNKIILINELNSHLKSGKLDLCETNTVNEVMSFGFDSNTNKYTSQIGNDDLVMSTANVCELFRSFDWSNIVSEIYDTVDPSIKNKIEKILDENASDNDSEYDEWDLINDMQK